MFLGFVGNDTAAGAPAMAIANDAIAIGVTGDMTVRGDTWVGKMATGPLTMFPYGEFPIAATKDVTVTVAGNLLVDIDESKLGEQGLMIFTGGNNGSIVRVAGDVMVTGGHNHVYDEAAGTALLEAKTLAMSGGSFEVIGAAASVKTTSTAAGVNAITLGGGSEVMLMAGGVLDASAGGDVLVNENGSLQGYFFMNNTAGEVKLNAAGTLRIAESGTLSLEAGSVKTAGGGAVEIAGNLVLGHIGPANNMFAPGVDQFTDFVSDGAVSVTDTAKISLSSAFVNKALASHTTVDANVNVITGASVDYAGWTGGDKTLFENLYGKFNFTKDATSVKFKNVEANDLSDAGKATAAATRQIKKVYVAAGMGSRKIPSGMESIMLGVSGSATGVAIPGVGPVTKTGAAGALNAAFCEAFALADSASFSFTGGGVTGTYSEAYQNMIDGNRGSGVNAISMNAADQFRNAVGGRIAANNAVLARVREQTGSDTALASIALNGEYMNRVWAGAMGLWEDADNRKGMSGYKFDSYGLMVGYDRLFGPVTVGAAFGYTDGDYEDKAAMSSDSDIQSYSVNLYATYNHCSGFFASVIGGYTYSDNDINEFDGTHWSREDFHTGTWNIGARLGYDRRPADNFTLTPSIGLNHAHAKNSGHQVNYAGVDLLTYGAMKNHSTSVPVELAASYDVVNTCDSTLNLNASVGYSYNFDDDGIEGDINFNGLGGVGSLRASGRELGHHALNVGAGMKYTYKNLDFGVRYDYFAKSDYDAHRLVGTVGLSF